MPSEKTPALTITPAKLGFALSLVTAVTVGWNVVSYFKGQEIKDLEQDQRIAVVESNGERFEKSIGRLTDKTDQLNDSIIRLTTVLEQSGPEKRADLFLGLDQTHPVPLPAAKR